jgi:hypothetical protein
MYLFDFVDAGGSLAPRSVAGSSVLPSLLSMSRSLVSYQNLRHNFWRAWHSREGDEQRRRPFARTELPVATIVKMGSLQGFGKFSPDDTGDHRAVKQRERPLAASCGFSPVQRRITPIIAVVRARTLLPGSSTGGASRFHCITGEPHLDSNP